MAKCTNCSGQNTSSFKKCDRCRAVDRAYYYANKERICRQMRERDPEARYAYNIKRWYGLTIEEYRALLKAQGGGCAMCKSKEPAGDRVKRFSVDHDHDTGRVRGLLCNRCNHLLGCAGDDIDLLLEAILYLGAH